MTKPITQADIGSHIRQARERIGMSQKDLAQAVGRDQKAISEYESGSRKMYASELALFASVLNVPVRFFYEGAIDSNDLDQTLLHEFHAFPSDEHKQDAISLLRVFLKSLKRPQS